MDPNDVLEMSTDEAVLSALTPKKLEELELKPFSLLRQTIASDLSSSGGSSNFYNIVLTVWVCTLTPKECMEARDDVSGSRIKAFEWAESRGYSMGNSDSFKPLIDAYVRINRELMASIKIKTRNNGGDGDIPKNDGRQLDS